MQAISLWSATIIGEHERELECHIRMEVRGNNFMVVLHEGGQRGRIGAVCRSDRGQRFFRIQDAAPGAITLTALAGEVGMDGDESFDVPAR